MNMMAKSFVVGALFASLPLLSNVYAQPGGDRVTVTDQGTYTLPASRNLTLRHLRSMKVNVVAAEGNQVRYNASITANKLGMERHFGDGKLKYSNIDGLAILEYKPYEQQEVREQSWLKSLLTKEKRYDAIVDKAELTVTVPADVHLTIDSRYSDISVAGMRRALRLVGRYGAVWVRDQVGDLNISNLYGGVTVEGAEGSVDVQSQSSTVKVGDVRGRLSISGRAMNLDIGRVSGDVTVGNRSGTNQIRNLDSNLRIESNYGSIQLADIRGEAIVETRSATKLEAQRVGSLRVNATSSSMTLTDVGGNGGTEISGSSLKVNGSGIVGNLRTDLEQSTLTLDRFGGLADIRSSNGTLQFNRTEGDVKVTGGTNTIRFAEHAGSTIDVRQSRGAVDVQAAVVPVRYSIETSSAPVSVTLPSTFKGRYMLRNDQGLIEHNLAGTEVSIDAKVSAEEAGGSGSSEVRVVNRNGNISVKKQR